MRQRIFVRLAFMLLLLTATGTAAAYDYIKQVRGDYSGKADTLTKVLIDQFMLKAKGYFKETPTKVGQYIYWQQAHAMDVVVYSYLRIKDDNPTLANTYKAYMQRWYQNHANNYHNDPSDPTGFLNPFTDDMCWIGLTLTHISDALGDNTYFDTARTLYDRYIITRGWTDNNGYFGLPWKSDDMGRNACTNAPGCLLATLLYQKYGDEKYLNDAKAIFDFMENVQMPRNEAGNLDWRVEEPPLTYTQGTFSEACRQLYHITGEEKYLNFATRVMNFAFTSTRCNQKVKVQSGTSTVEWLILRHEGTSMDQSLFKAVLIPYAVNMMLDEDFGLAIRRTILVYLQNNADILWKNLDLTAYPRMYCNYFWSEPYTGTRAEASMGAMASGASLMEGVARMCKTILTPTGISIMHNEEASPLGGLEGAAIYDLQGRKVADNPSSLIPFPSGARPPVAFHPSSKKGIYIVNGRKVMVK